MTAEQQELVRTSFARLAIMPEVFAAIFYERLFQLAPQVRELFKHDMRVQGIKLMGMLTAIVFNLHTPDDVLPAVIEMGKRHVSYGVSDSDYDVLGKTLLLALEEVLGEEFTPEARDAWTACYDEVAGQMRQAAQDA